MRAWPSLVFSIVLVATVALPVTTGVSAALQVTDHSFAVPFSGPASSDAYNWAGYAETSAAGSVTQVSASWTQPAVKCPKGTTLAAFWVGIDGYNSETVEQTGTLAQCYHGQATYYAWWETYPANAVQEFGSVNAGDQFTASVTFDSSTGVFDMTITDTTSGTTWSESSTNSGAQESSAECIAERPSGASNASGFYALSNFGTVKFSSCSATVSGTTGGIGSFSSVYEITMVSYPSGTRVLARPSALSDSATFSVKWKHAS